jgi:alpha-beta hydrolase superfamily lysophospholipase
MTEPGTIQAFTASDGYRLHYRRYPARGEPRGRVVCIHGIQSHGGWYPASCAYLAEQGWQVDFLDRRGSGLNEQARGDCPHSRRLLLDLAEVLPAEGGPAPVLVAISWGAKLGIALERFRPGLLGGLVLLAPGLCPVVGPSLRQRLAIVWSRLVTPGRLFPIPLDDPELFTATPHWQAFIRDDPLSLRRATARLLVASVFLDRAARRAASHVRAPALLLLAGQDRIVDNDRTRAYFARLGSSDKTVVEYPQAHHTLEFEPDPTPIFADLARWLEQRTPHLKRQAGATSFG